MSGFLAHLTAKAAIWRARGPTRHFILNRMPRGRWCPMHGAVTRYHFCSVSCEVTGFRCLPGCTKAECGAPVIATSAWIGKVPTGPATKTGAGA